jgi:hypothetical protein
VIPAVLGEENAGSDSKNIETTAWVMFATDSGEVALDSPDFTSALIVRLTEYIDKNDCLLLPDAIKSFKYGRSHAFRGDLGSTPLLISIPSAEK